MAEGPTDEEVGQSLRKATASLRATREALERQRLEAAVNRFEARHRPSRRPDLRLIQGGRAKE